MFTLCSVGDCAKASRVKGMCEAHYRRARRYGDPSFEHSLECAHCGQAFSAWSSRAKYCSGACGGAARTVRQGFTCAECAAPIAWNSKTSAPQGTARCRACQNGGRGYYTYGDGRRVSHGLAGYSKGCRCDVCTVANRASARAYMKRYSAKHGEAYSSTWRRKFKAEHGYWPQGSGFDFVDIPTRHAIYDRDGWTCQLCGDAISPDATAHADRASLDHIVPQSRGGSHEPSNLRMAHVGCNARRGDRVGELEGV